MKTYKLDFDVWKEYPSVWTEREAKNMIDVFSVCRIGIHTSFDSYGTFTFAEDDPNQWHPIIETQEEFNKKTTNCIIFNLEVDNCDYDKVFIYMNRGGYNGHSGYYIYSSTDPTKHIHKYYLVNDLNSIIISLNKVVYDLDKRLGNPRKIKRLK